MPIRQSRNSSDFAAFGALCLHFRRFKGTTPESNAKPDREQRCQIGKHTFVLQAWMGLHLKAVAALVGMVVCVTVLNAEGKPKFKKPLNMFTCD